MPDDHYPSFDLRGRIADLARGDAGHVILAVALLDQLLEALVLAYMPNMSDDHAKMLFSHPGPLSSFPAKSKFAYALRLIESDTYQDLKGIQRVRNAFAHPRGFFHFKSPEVAEVFKGIKQWPSKDDLRALLDERVTSAAAAMQAKFDTLIYKHASEG